MEEFINEYLIIFFIVILIILSRLDLKYILLSIIVLCIIFYYYQYIITNEMNDNKDDNISTKINSNVSSIFDNLKTFRKDNLIEYKLGLKYWVKFTSEIKTPNPNYENAETYLDASIFHFKSLILVNKESKIYIDNLYTEGLRYLKRIAKKNNKKWVKEPNIYENQIVFNSPKPYNTSFI
jgi:hypothetical protein